LPQAINTTPKFFKNTIKLQVAQLGDDGKLRARLVGYLLSLAVPHKPCNTAGCLEVKAD